MPKLVGKLPDAPHPAQVEIWRDGVDPDGGPLGEIEVPVGPQRVAVDRSFLVYLLKLSKHVADRVEDRPDPWDSLPLPRAA